MLFLFLVSWSYEFYPYFCLYHALYLLTCIYWINFEWLGWSLVGHDAWSSWWFLVICLPVFCWSFANIFIEETDLYWGWKWWSPCLIIFGIYHYLDFKAFTLLTKGAHYHFKSSINTKATKTHVIYRIFVLNSLTFSIKSASQILIPRHNHCIILYIIACIFWYWYWSTYVYA